MLECSLFKLFLTFLFHLFLYIWSRGFIIDVSTGQISIHIWLQVFPEQSVSLNGYSWQHWSLYIIAQGGKLKGLVDFVYKCTKPLSFKKMQLVNLLCLSPGTVLRGTGLKYVCSQNEKNVQRFHLHQCMHLLHSRWGCQSVPLPPIPRLSNLKLPKQILNGKKVRGSG